MSSTRAESLYANHPPAMKHRPGTGIVLVRPHKSTRISSNHCSARPRASNAPTADGRAAFKGARYIVSKSSLAQCHYRPLRSTTDYLDASMASKSEIAGFLAASFPQSKCLVVEVGNGSATVEHPVGEAELRPGGSVSGPVLMTVADVALYVAILGEIGIVPLTVTTSLNINFLRKPAPEKSIIGVCKLIKLGKTLAVGEVSLYSEGSAAMIAHAVGTYAIPKHPSR